MKFRNEGYAEVLIIGTTKGKKLYMLSMSTDRLGAYNSRVVISDARGFPMMWTTKKDMLSYAKKHGLRIMSGYNTIGGYATGVKWQ